MKTTLDIDEDILTMARELARRQHMSTGRMVSRLLRRGLSSQEAPLPSMDSLESSIPSVAGFRPFPVGRVVSNAVVNALRETEGV